MFITESRLLVDPGRGVLFTAISRATDDPYFFLFPSYFFL
jgi:hypothetical protein